MRFNPPPNWPPSPPGWTPPPGWQPDPTWPPPPPGWQLWVQDGPAGRSRTPLIIGGAVAAVLVVIGVVLAVVLTGSDGDSGGVASSRTTTSEPDTTDDEEQIEARVQEFETAWNNEDFGAIEEIVCEEIKGEPDFTEQDFLESRSDTGRLSLSFEGADIIGDTAIVDIQEEGQATKEFDFARENGEWMWCEL